ncbi:hypothetical protein AKJ62_01160 [candidate division MSBL1 archaeon SCGC-AAA259D14]|uniref:Phosphofructokinase domain-containing protein n=1 Tax=candidate division MSBL1 archaeon SCGC-AAA259D14 TaxID=1698261 RepID=A0A133U7W7_9EURY|nr:hypothetical protein AKJ62_01160 [candidate division MSBL1 archaeon SCGC-AAA259D14]
MKIAVLTGGGHVSGLNAGIEGITKEAIGRGGEVLGVLNGWEGMEKGEFVKLTEENTDLIKNHGGSILGSGRWKPDLDKVAENAREKNLDGIVALGGDDTLSVLAKLWEQHDFPSAGWPKTMDNDLGGTYFSIGYPKAVQKSAETVLDSFDVACTHRRIALVSVFGRSTDWVAAGAAAYGDADMIIPGEKETEMGEIYDKAKEVFHENKKDYGRPYAVIVVAEGASIEGLETHVKVDDIHTDDFGHPKLDPHELVSSLADAIKVRSTEEGQVINTAPMALTYQLRNGRPLDIDKKLGYECGQECVKILEEEPGKMASIKREEDELIVGREDLSEGVKVKKVADTDYIDYENFEVTDHYLDYARLFLGEKPHRELRFL